MKYIVGLAVLIMSVVVAYAGWNAYTSDMTVVETGTTEPRVLTLSNPTDFAKVGTITVGNPGQGQSDMYLVYEEPGAPALSEKIILDGLSTCTTETGSLPCLAMSVTFDIPFGGKRAVVEGEKTDGGVLLRKLRVVAEGGTTIAPQPGSVFIPWPQAVMLIEACEVASVMQTHALDVHITLLDGTTLRAVEPIIDQVFNAIEKADACAPIQMATE